MSTNPMTSSKNTLIITDLDGTLIDYENYTWDAAKEALAELKKQGIPLVFCTSKTKAETERYRSEMSVGAPFIVENGGAIIIPRKYFDFDYEFTEEEGDYKTIKLAQPYEKAREAIEKVEELKNIPCFGRMPIEEITSDAGLSMAEAALAKKREYGEVFIYNKDIPALVEERAQKEGLSLIRGGRYMHAGIGIDKGNAVRILKGLYLKKFEQLTIISLGDSLSDAPMLKEADLPVLIMKTGGNYAPVELSNLIKSSKAGPVGWNEEVLNIIKPKV